MWTIIAAWLRGKLKWILGALAGFLAIGAFIFMVHSLIEAGRENGKLHVRLAAEQETRAALEADYQTLVNVLEQERQAAEDTAAAADQLTKDIQDESDQDRPVGPVLRRAVDGLRRAAASEN